MKRIKTPQTRDCYFAIYEQEQTNDFAPKGFYFFDDEFEPGAMIRNVYDTGYFGPYSTLNDACKAQHRYYSGIMKL